MLQLPPGYELEHAYRIERMLGAGGMGQVYLAHDLAFDREVAVKLLVVPQDDDDRQRFLVEAKALSAIRHKSVCAVYKFGLVGEQTPYLVMEYVKGISLREKILQKSLTIKESLSVASSLCEALHAVHSAGIIHRDVKPENVMICGTGLKLIDFGLCRTSDQQLTQPGTCVGSVMYISPEQCLGERAQPLSDMYAVGAIIFELLTGEQIFAADNPVAMVHMHAKSEAPSLRQFGRCDVVLEELVNRCLAKTPENRPSALELKQQLDLLLQKGEAQLFVPLKQRKSVQKYPQQTKLIPLVVSVLAIVVCASIALGPGMVLALERFPHSQSLQNFALADIQILDRTGFRDQAFKLGKDLLSTLDADTSEKRAESRIQIREKLSRLMSALEPEACGEITSIALNGTLREIKTLAKSDPPHELATWTDETWAAYRRLLSQSAKDRTSKFYLSQKLRHFTSALVSAGAASDFETGLTTWRPGLGAVHSKNLDWLEQECTDRYRSKNAARNLALSKFTLAVQTSQLTKATQYAEQVLTETDYKEPLSGADVRNVITGLVMLVGNLKDRHPAEALAAAQLAASIATKYESTLAMPDVWNKARAYQELAKAFHWLEKDALRDAYIAKTNNAVRQDVNAFASWQVQVAAFYAQRNLNDRAIKVAAENLKYLDKLPATEIARRIQLDSLNYLTCSLQAQANIKELIEACEQYLPKVKTVEGISPQASIVVWYRYGFALRSAHQLDRAESAIKNAMRIAEGLPAQHYVCTEQLFWIYYERQDYVEADKWADKTLNTARQAHLSCNHILNSLGYKTLLAIAMKRPADAKKFSLEALDITQKEPSTATPARMVSIYFYLSQSELGLGHQPEADRYFKLCKKAEVILRSKQSRT